MIGFWWFSVRWSYSPWCKWVLQRTAVPVPHLHNPAVITKGSVTGDFLGVWCPMLQHSTVVTLQHGWILHSAFIVWALQRRASVGVLNLGRHACIIQVWTCPQMPSSQKYGSASSFSISNMWGFLQANSTKAVQIPCLNKGAYMRPPDWSDLEAKVDPHGSCQNVWLRLWESWP